MRCPDCGEDNPARARFCLSCGAALEAASARELRKTVTIVFCDLSGSTGLGERLDPESLRRVQLRYFEAMRTALERHGGIVEKYIGDAVMAVFGIPRVHEDDALRAVRAAQDMLEELAALNAELERDHDVTLQVRIGVNTGPVVSGDPEAGRALVTGDAVNVAARLEQAAAPGEILLGEATHRLVRDAVVAEDVSPVEAKGKSEPVRAWRLVSVLPGAEAVARRLDVPIVGRERELRLLREAFERAATERACVLLTILGAPGVGKSRLVEEFLGGIDAEVLRGRCLPYGEGITYWPVVEMLTRRARISDRDRTEQVGEKLRGLVGSDPEGELVAERLAQLFGTAGVPVAAEETFWALRRLLEALARTSPVIVDLDDVQWAEPTLVDLIEYLGAWTREAPILLLCSARPDLLDTRPSWGSTVPGATSIELEPLPTEEAERLAAEHLVGVPREVAERIAEVAEGVPLFVEQLAAMLVDDGTLTREDGGWAVRADLASIRVPPTVAALIDARLERLPPEELDVLEHAAVEGKGFHRGAVLALTPGDARDQVSARLLSLLRRGLIRPAESLFTGDDAYAFRHLLIRDAAYARISKEERADLHERHAGWLEEASSRAVEFDEFVGYHLEQASRLRNELAPGDERAREVGERAAARLGAAGRRAFERGDLRGAGSLLSRADALLPPSAVGRVEIQLALGTVHEREGRYGEALAELATAERLAREADDVGAAARAVARRQFVRSHVEETPQVELQAEVRAYLPELEAAGEETAIAEACLFLGVSSLWLGRETLATELLERARVLAARVGARWVASEAASWLPAVMATSPMPAVAVVERWRELSGSMQMSRGTRAVGDFLCAPAVAMTGDLDAARAGYRGAREVLAELGHEVSLYASTMMAAQVELLDGELSAAEELLVEGDRALERLGEAGYRSTVLCFLADSLQAQGRAEEAIGATERAEGISFPDDIETNSGWRSARARALADLGSFGEAERLAREAIDVLAPTESLDLQSRSWTSLGYVLASAGLRDEALEAYREALGLLERKANVLSAARVRHTMAVLRGDDPPPAELPPGAWGTTWPLGP
jgi:class 3 adenylate cyclase/tetratricopeptide (TPR) repeat protein